MEVKAIAKNVRISPRKLRLIADTVRGLSVSQALEVLEITQKRAASPIYKVIKSAISNAKVNNNLEEENLLLSRVMVQEGQALKRFHPASRGRVHPYKKKASHIVITLKEKDKTENKVVEEVKEKVEEKKVEQSAKRGGKASSE